MRPPLISLIAALLLVACPRHKAGPQPVELPLSAVDSYARGDQPAPIATAYRRYGNTRIAVQGVRLGPGLPAGLGSQQFVGLHEPPAPGQAYRVLLSGKVPPDHGKRYRVVGRIVRSGGSYTVAVESWTEVERK